MEPGKGPGEAGGVPQSVLSGFVSYGGEVCLLGGDPGSDLMTRHRTPLMSGNVRRYGLALWLTGPHEIRSAGWWASYWWFRLAGRCDCPAPRRDSGCSLGWDRSGGCADLLQNALNFSRSQGRAGPPDSQGDDQLSGPMSLPRPASLDYRPHSTPPGTTTALPRSKPASRRRNASGTSTSE